MHKKKAELIEFIADIKTKKQIEKEIQTRYTIYEELVDTDTIAFLLVDELGRNKALQKSPILLQMEIIRSSAGFSVSQKKKPSKGKTGLPAGSSTLRSQMTPAPAGLCCGTGISTP